MSPDSKLPKGTRYCQCSACRQYFTAESAFNTHRVSFACQDPAARGLVLSAKGYWGKPGPAEQMKFTSQSS